VRRGTLESIARLAAGDMPRKLMDRPLVNEIRQVLDAMVLFHLERELRSARFMRETILPPRAATPAPPV
jgi:hypothetical protein